MLGRVLTMRVLLAMTPDFRGTLKSALNRTRFPLTYEAI